MSVLSDIARFMLNREEWSEDPSNQAWQVKNKTLRDILKGETTIRRNPSYEEESKPKYDLYDVPEFVPAQYRSAIAKHANEYDIDPKVFSALIHTENTPWDPSAKNPKSSAAGLGQHTDAYVKDYGKAFAEKYGRDYDRTNPEDSIAATFIGLDSLRKRTGSLDDAIKAYHGGVRGMGGKYKEDAERYYSKVMSWISPKDDVALEQ